jgi:hypothetical protein
LYTAWTEVIVTTVRTMEIMPQMMTKEMKEVHRRRRDQQGQDRHHQKLQGAKQKQRQKLSQEQE